MKRLIHYLSHTAPGEIADTGAVEHLLEECWEELDGSAALGMVGHKLLGRMENAIWCPPMLRFAIERHVACGSTHVILERWRVDLHRNTAGIEKTEPRKLYRLSLATSVEEAGEEIAQAILAGVPDDRLRWEEDGSASVLASWEFPRTSTFSRTLGSRRMRLCRCIADAISGHGWKAVGRNRFKRVCHGNYKTTTPSGLGRWGEFGASKQAWELPDQSWPSGALANVERK